MNKNKIIFIGMMGSGKTQTAKKLAAIKNIKLYDTDEIFEKENNIKIKDYFEKFGEENFRKQESEILKKIIKNDSYIISSGGGIVLKEENRKLLFNKNITTIYLKATPDTIFERLKEDTKRPLLQVQNPKKEIEKIIKDRENLYEKASYIINTDNKTIDNIIEEIENKLWKKF